MSQQPLWIDTWRDAAKALIDACGGPKKVGAALRSDLGAEEAADWLLKTLNPKRREVMTAEQFIALLAIGRAHGCDVLMAFSAERAGYEPPKAMDLATETARTATNVANLLADVQRQMDRLQHVQAVLGGTGIARA